MASKRPDGLIRIPAAISKDELEQVTPLYGATNAGQFAGNPPSTLRLKTFAGKYDLTARVFVGEYRFEATSTPGELTFALLPGVDAGPKKRAAKAENLESVTHG